MEEHGKVGGEGEVVFVGVDLHCRTWHVTVRTKDVELFSGGVPGRWEMLKHLLERYRECRVKVVYEAGYFGFGLYDEVSAWGAECIVTPPSLMPRDYGNRVKTDKKDSRKLADMLSRGMLKAIWVPSPQQRAHRQLLRSRRQLVGDRVRTQIRIKAFLRLYGIEIPEPRGKWSQAYLETLRQFKFADLWLGESFQRLLEEYDFLNQQIKKQTALLQKLSQTEAYRQPLGILRSTAGIGLIASLEILLEIGDFGRFPRAEQLPAYLGLTPSQYSSGDKIRMGRITAIGKNSLRAMLIEVCWKLIAHDRQLRSIYEKLKMRCGSKRAIVAIARRLTLRLRRMMLDSQPYREHLLA